MNENPLLDSTVTEFSLPPATSTKEILARMAEGIYLLDPVMGCQDLVRANLSPGQQQVVRQLFLGRKKKVSIRAGHG